jgi:hypothetical protein
MKLNDHFGKRHRNGSSPGPQSINHYDEIIPLQEMEFDSLTQMWVAGKQVEVAPTAQRLLSNRLRVPYSYLSRCPAELQARNLNYWIEQERQHGRPSFAGSTPIG